MKSTDSGRPSHQGSAPDPEGAALSTHGASHSVDDAPLEVAPSSGASPLKGRAPAESRRDAESAEQRFRDEPPCELREITHRIIGAAIEVHRHLGPGLLEAAYERALAIELELCEIPYERQVPLVVTYKGIVVGDQRADLVVANQVVVELKAADSISTVHVQQVIAYLKAGMFRLGLLINFNVPVLHQGIRRIVSSP